MLPDSNQQSITSGLPFILFLHLPHFRWILSTTCLCKSTLSGTFSMAFFCSSFMLPMTATFLHFSFSHFHAGIDVAQNLFLDMLQSGAVSSMSLNLPFLMCCGYQFISAFFSISLDFIFCMSTNQEFTAL